MLQMKADFQAVLQLEQAAADSGASLQILNDLKPLLTPLVRIMYLLFEQDSWQSESEGGVSILRGLLRTLPDSKIVEDLHGVVRQQRNSQRNKKQSCHQIQELVTQSNVLSEREIRHVAAIDRECFLQAFKGTPDRKRLKRYYARAHALPERWSNIMARKNWGTLSEEVLLRGAAAFAFLRAYRSQDMKMRGVRISHGLFSKFAPQLAILSFEDPLHVQPSLFGLCLGHYDWGFLLWPIVPFFPGSNEWWSLDPAGEVCWAHIVEPMHWKVMRFDIQTYAEDLILLRYDHSESLMKHFFGNVRNHNLLSKSCLVTLGEYLGVLYADSDKLKKMPRLDLIDSVLDMICDGDVGWTEPIKIAMRKPKLAEEAAADELDQDFTNLVVGTVLDEVLLSELTLDERQDFKEVQAAVNRKVSGPANGWALVHRNGKGKGRGRGRGRSAAAKAKSKAKAQAKPKPSAKSSARGRGGGKRAGKTPSFKHAAAQLRGHKRLLNALEDCPRLFI